MYRICRSNNKGFTLIEVLVAVALSAILIVALYTTFFTVLRAGERTDESFDSLVSTARFLDRFTSDVHASHLEQTDEVTRFTGGISGKSSTISFTAFTWPHVSAGTRGAGAPPASDLIRVSYYAEVGPDGRYTLFREVKNPYSPEGTVGFKAEVISPVREFEVSYYNGLVWAKAWDSTLEGALPLAVRATITLQDGRVFKALAKVMIR